MIAERTVHEIHTTGLHVVDEPWPFAISHAAEIEAHWHESVVRNPHLFNGDVFVLREHTVEAGILRGQYVPTDFASYLYWRDRGFDDPPTCDGFAIVLLRSRQGKYFLAEAAAHTLNGGFHVPPGGCFDARDVTSCGAADITACALRELAEETGLTREDIVIDDGYLVTRIGCLVAIAVQARCLLEDDEVLRRVSEHNKKQDTPELGECLWYSPDEDANTVKIHQTIKLLITHVPGRG